MMEIKTEKKNNIQKFLLFCLITNKAKKTFNKAVKCDYNCAKFK